MAHQTRMRGADLACLAHMQGGEITCPSGMFSTFYLSQRPYLVSGSLRDQVTLFASELVRDGGWAAPYF